MVTCEEIVGVIEGSSGWNMTPIRIYSSILEEYMELSSTERSIFVVTLRNAAALG